METALSSGKKTADAIITSNPSKLTGVLIITDGTNDAKVVLHNGDDGTGPILFEGTVKGAGMFGGATWEIPVAADQGIYADVTGTNAAYIVYYRPA
jgi:hypothetical protein